ncbi:MAG: hypothetical protein AAFR41_09715 [Pseudomonadota bacterium]
MIENRRRHRYAIVLGAILAIVGCAGTVAPDIRAQPSYGYDLPVVSAVAVVGLDEPSEPILNAEGGEVPKGVFTPPVAANGLADPADPGAS